MVRQSGSCGEKILLITREYLKPHISGNGVYANQLVDALRSHWDARVVTTYVKGPLPRFVVHLPVSSKNWTMKGDAEFILKGLLRFDDIVNLKPCLVVGVDWKSAPLGLVLGKRLGCPLVWMPFRIFSYSSNSVLIRGLEKLIARNADEIIALSSVDAALIKKFFKRKASILHPPVTLEAQAKPDEKSNVILTVARISPEKGIERLIRAMQRIRPELTLVIAGGVSDKQYFKRLENLSCGLGVEGRVTFTGRGSQNELSSLYSRARVYLSSSIYEPFGLSIIEAAYHSLPIVMDNTGLNGAGTLFTHSQDCLKVDMVHNIKLAEAVNSLFEDPSTAHRLGKNAKNVADQLSSLAFEEKINSFILRVINREEHDMERC